MKKFLLAGCVALSAHSFSQTVIYADDFENTTGWDLNPTNNGLNEWAINASYTGNGPAAIPNVPDQPAGVTNSPQSLYLHILSHGNCYGFVPVTCNAHFDPAAASDNYAEMNADLNTTADGNVTLTFWYLCGGEEDVSYGTVEYSTDGGANWTQTGDPLFGVTTWTEISFADPAFDGQSTLRFRFRWQNGGSGINPGFALDDVKITSEHLTTDAITMQHLNDDHYCAGTSETVGFEAIGTFNTGNVFTAQLSDAAGSFAAPVNIGTLASTTNGIQTMPVVFPAGTTEGTGYRVRVISSDEALTGGDNGADVTIHALPEVSVTATPADGTICEGSSAALSASGAAAYSWSPAGTVNPANMENTTATPAATTTYTVTGTSQDGCSAAADFTVTVEDCTGLGEQDALSFSVYPNPASDVVHIRFDMNAKVMSIELLDQSGRVIRTVSDKDFSIADLGQGSYFVRVTTANGTETARITKK